MPWKKTDEGALAVDEETGNPVFVNADGEEQPYDVDRAQTTLAKWRKGEEENRKKAEELQKALEARGEQDADVERLKKRLEAAEKGGANAEAVAKLRDELETAQGKAKTFEEELSKVRGALSKRDDEVYRLTVRAGFDSHPLFVGVDGKQPETVLTPAKAFAAYGDHFRVENGVIVGYDRPVPRSGDVPEGATRIVSKRQESLGDPAGFTEAVRILFENDPDRKSLTRPSGAEGGGAGGSDRPAGSQGKFTPEQVDSMSQKEYEEARAKGLI